MEKENIPNWMNEEERATASERFYKFCNYWFGEKNYSVWDASRDSRTSIWCTGYCQNDGYDFDADEKHTLHEFALFIDEDGARIDVRLISIGSDHKRAKWFVTQALMEYFLLRVDTERLANDSEYLQGIIVRLK